MTVLKNIDTVILHTPKTGGSSVRWPAIRLHDIRYSCQHCHYKMLPAEYNNFRKVTFVRNPIDWYASRYFFDKKKAINRFFRKEPFTDALSLNYKLGFEETLYNMLNLTEAFKNKKILELYKKILKHEVLNNYQCWQVSFYDNFNDIEPEIFNNKSLYQWSLDITGVSFANAVYRLEDQYAEGMRKEFGNRIELIHKNKTVRKKSQELYNKTMINAVVNKDKKIIDKYYDGKVII